MFGIDAAIYVYCTYVFVENKNLKPETWNITGKWAFYLLLTARLLSRGMCLWVDEMTHSCK